jgi:O-antigen/teichoic acid export membrane protein
MRAFWTNSTLCRATAHGLPETDPAAAAARSTALARGVLVNALGILVKASRSLYLIVFSRLLGADGFGVYLLAFAIQEAAGKVGILGLHWGGKQAVGALLAEGRDGAVRRAVLRILALALFGSACAAAALYFAAPAVAGLMGHAEAAAPLRVFSLALPFMSGMYVLVYALRPRLDMKYEVIVTSVIEPVTVLLAGLALLAWQRNVVMAAWAHVAAALVAFVAAAIAFRHVYPRSVDSDAGRMDGAQLAHGSFTMGSMDLLGNLKSRIDFLVLARFLPAEMLGVYGAVSEIAAVLRKSRAAFDPIIMPIAQRLHLRHDLAGLQHETTRAVGWALQMGLGLLAVIVLVPGWLLGLFGSDFAGPVYAQALMILAAGQLVHMSLGLSEGILAITGHGYVGLRNALALMVADIVLLMLLIPHWGLLGAAAATSTTTVVVTSWRAVQTRRLLGLYMVVPGHLRLLLRWALALALGLGVRAAAGGSALGDGLALAVFALAFAGLSRRSGDRPEENAAAG